ncbi:MAG: Hpt domain-containing protein [Azospirillum sp.]|nr:Hpt domain-containing protein [Azospirillum sp.]
MSEHDLRVLDQLTEEVGAEVLNRLLRTFFGEASVRIADFNRLSTSNGDASEMHRTVHSLKSAAGSFGATKLAALAAELEQDIEDGVYRHDPAAIAQLGAHFEAFKAAVAARGISVD